MTTTSSAAASAAPRSSARYRVRETRCGWKSARSRLPGNASRAAAIVGGDLGGMVGVVVDDRDAPRLRDLEAAAGAGEAAERLGRLAAIDPRELERREGGPRVRAVVLARQRERAVEGRSAAHRARKPPRSSARTPPRARRARRTRCGGRARRSSPRRSPREARTPSGRTRRPRRRATPPPPPRCCRAVAPERR